MAAELRYLGFQRPHVHRGAPLDSASTPLCEPSSSVGSAVDTPSPDAGTLIADGRAIVMIETMHNMLSSIYNDMPRHGVKQAAKQLEAKGCGVKQATKHIEGKAHLYNTDADVHMANLFDFVEKTTSRSPCLHQATHPDCKEGHSEEPMITSEGAREAISSASMLVELRVFFDEMVGTMQDIKKQVELIHARNDSSTSRVSAPIAKVSRELTEPEPEGEGDAKREGEASLNECLGSQKAREMLDMLSEDIKKELAAMQQFIRDDVISLAKTVQQHIREDVPSLAKGHSAPKHEPSQADGTYGPELHGADFDAEPTTPPPTSSPIPMLLVSTPISDAVDGDDSGIGLAESPHMVLADNATGRLTTRRRGNGSLRVDHRLSHVFGSLYDTLGDPQYAVTNQYHSTGLCQSVARNNHFHWLTVFMLILNAVYIGIAADHNHGDSLYRSPLIFILCDNLFCLFFIWELAVRWFAFMNKRDFLQDAWCRFDTLLVLLMIIEVWIMEPIIFIVLDDGSSTASFAAIFRLVRLVRLMRMSRLMEIFPEGMTLMKSFFAGLRAVFSILLFITGLNYCFAIVLDTCLKNVEEVQGLLLAPHHFSTVPECMWTLLMHGTLLLDPDEILSPLLLAGEARAIISVFVFMLFILISAVTFMNMLIGVLVEVVSQVSKRERNDADILAMKKTILKDLLLIDTNRDGYISRGEFFEVMNAADAIECLTELNIDRSFLTELAMVTLPEGENAVELSHIMELMLMCRGDLPFTVQHMAYAHASLTNLLKTVFGQVGKCPRVRA